MDIKQSRHFLRMLFDTAIEAVQPEKLMQGCLPTPAERNIVVGAGKACGAMARALENQWQGHLEGQVVVPHGYSTALNRIKLIEAGHPVPDKFSQIGSMRILSLVENLTEEDQVIVLLSGGGTSLMTLPPSGVGLDEKIQLMRRLARCGASVSEQKCVRNQVSKIKGGQLAQAIYPAKLTTLMISDVPGDYPEFIASGPTQYDSSIPEDAQEIIEKYDVPISQGLHHWLYSAKGKVPRLSAAKAKYDTTQIIGNAEMAMDAAAKFAEEKGYQVIMLGDMIEGEAIDIAKMHAEMALKITRNEYHYRAPAVILSGGETTVSVGSSTGRGGRNQEYALGLALGLKGNKNVCGIACDTDGMDGGDRVAGAIVTPDTIKRGSLAGLSLREIIDNHDTYRYFNTLGDHVVTGRTETNVNDFRAIIIEKPGV